MKKHQLFLLVSTIIAISIVLSSCVAVVTPSPTPAHYPEWHVIRTGQTGTLKCDNLWHSSSYFAYVFTIPYQSSATQVTIYASVTAIEEPPSNFYVFLMTKDNYYSWLNGANVPLVDGADLTQYSGSNYVIYASDLPIGSYTLVIWNDYPAIVNDYPGQAIYDVEAYY